jgi:hypothetical protein
MSETLTKLRPDRDLQCYFFSPSAIAALSQTSATGFTVSGSFRQQFDWTVIEWNRDNVFEHPALRNLPDGDLSGIKLSYQESRMNSIQLDSTWFPTVDWPFLRIWADVNGSETIYKVPLTKYATAVGSYVNPTVQFELQGTITAGDYIELSWLDQHFNYQVNGGDTLTTAIESLASAITLNKDSGLVTAVPNGNAITLTYLGGPGTNGNRVGVYGMVHGAKTESWAPAFALFSGGRSPAAWQIDLDFSNLVDNTGAALPTLNNVRKLRWTYAADIQPASYVRSEFAVTITNWTVTGNNLQYNVAGPGSRRIEDSALDELTYSGSWSSTPLQADPVEPVSTSGGTIHWTSTPGNSVSAAYLFPTAHSLYLGTRYVAAGGSVSVQVDAGAPVQFSLAVPGEDVQVRIPVGQFAAGSHQVTVSHSGAAGTLLYFDFLEIALPTPNLPDFPTISNTTLATDWDTLHSQALAPERTAWIIQKLGFKGRANHYTGALWFYELTASGNQYASATVTFSGSPVFGSTTTITLDTTDITHVNLIGDTAETVAIALALILNAGSTGVWAQANGNVLTITARAMGTAGDAFSLAANTTSSGFTVEANSAALTNGHDGKWLTDLTSIPRINRAARDWSSAYFKALLGYGISSAASAFSMELGNGDDTVATGIAQRYPDGSPVWVNTPALQTNFSPQSTAYWREVHVEMAGIMSAAGMTPYMQFGEVQWWYFASPGVGMPFYDAYTTSTFQAQFGRSMAVITSENESPSGLSQECSFLQGLVGQFTAAIRAYVRQTYPTAKFEVLYPPDTNDTALDQIVNFPTGDWTPANLACLKTENFIFTGSRNLNQARQSIALPSQMGFPPSQSSHLVGISDYTSPWARERALSIAAGCESVVLFALDQFCLVGYGLPLSSGARVARFMGA